MVYYTYEWGDKMNYLSTNIRYLRQKNNLTQDDISKIVNKSRVLVSQWESDEREITTEDIIKLSNYFNLPMDTLVGKDLRIKNDDFDELELLFSKNKDILTEDDKETMKFIIEKRKREIDKMLDGDG